MGMMMCEESFRSLIKQDIEWLLKQPKTLERDHIETILKEATSKYYNNTNSFSGWPSASNCIKNCKMCFAKCLYRKEDCEL